MIGTPLHHIIMSYSGVLCVWWSELQSTAGLQKMADQNLPMYDKIPDVVRQRFDKYFCTNDHCFADI